MDGSGVLTFRCSLIQYALHATYSTYSRGGSILINKAVPCTIHQVILDPRGRYLNVIADVYRNKMVLVNIYVPPPFQVQVLYELMGKLAPFMHLPLLAAGDFNAVLNAALDSSNLNRVSSVELSSWVATASLMELWCWKDPNTRRFSYPSKMHRSSSRIDLPFANDALL